MELLLLLLLVEFLWLVTIEPKQYAPTRDAANTRPTRKPKPMLLDCCGGVKEDDSFC